MRRLVLLVLLAPLPGCLTVAVDDSGRDCPVGAPVEDGFRVTLPEAAGRGANTVRTHGYCVSMEPGPGGGDRSLRSAREGVAWFAVDGPGTHRFHLAIRQPQDPQCAFWFEGQAEHPGNGVVDVALRHDGSLCA